MKNTITLQDIHEIIEKEEYQRIGKKTMICLLTLDNGFEVVGYSACVDPNNFDEIIGKNIAKQNAINKIWELEGYRIQWDLQPL